MKNIPELRSEGKGALITPGKYFTGDNVHGLVRASEAETFRDVVRILNAGALLNITRAEFLALEKKERDRIKQVSFFTAACFRSSPSRRTYDLATVCNLIFLDIDDPFDARPFVEESGLLYAALCDYNFFAYKTASSTPDTPRLRIVVEANSLPKEHYAAAVETIGALLGLSKVTPESKNPTQPMYFPTFFRRTSHEDAQ